MRLVQALLSAALITTSLSHDVEKREASEKRIVCYYTNWSVYRPGTAKYNPQNINPYLCTHLIYAFGGLDRENGLRPYDKYQDIEQGGYAKFTGLKTYNKALKTMLAIGGWNEGSARFSPLVADEERRAEFVHNVVKFLRQNHFDGLDLDWEYPAFRDGGKARDRDNYAQLVQELREEFDREHSKTGRPRLLLTMAVPAGIEYIDKGYDVPKLNRYLDFMNILSYDYHSAFEPAVNHHSPLYPLEEESEYNFDAQLSIDYTIKHYLKLGADRDKLVLGIPTYGRSYTLYNPESTDLGAPADGPGEQGDATREKGYLAYYEICGSLMKSSEDWVVRQPKRGAMGPYAYSGNQWVGYDDVDIVKEKSQYVSEKGLGGIMFWSIDNDDFRGVCHDRPYPLIEAGKEALLASSVNNVVSSPVRNKQSRPSSSSNSRRPLKPIKQKTLRPTTTTTTTPSPPRTPKGSLTTPEPPTTPDPGSDFVCKDEGFFPHPRDCKKYFWCLDSGPSNLGIVAHQFTCPSGLYFNKAADSCDYTRNVICNKKEKEKPTTKAPKVTPTTPKTTSSRVITTTTTTTTTTEAPVEEELEEDDEYYEEHAEEDPQAIKQLIQLIKKLGGVAELEKQLEGAAGGDSTPPPIPRSLYNKVITPKQRYQSSFVNGPSGPQNEGLSHSDDGSPYSRREKPQYVTIRRDRTSTEAPKEEIDEDTADTYEVSSSRPKYQTLERNRNRSSQTKQNEDESEEVTRSNTPKYATIQRNRPAKVEEEEDEEEEDRYRPKYTSIQRSRPSTIEESPAETTTSRYVTFRRQRPHIEKSEPEDEEEEDHTRGTTIQMSEEPIEDIKETESTSKVEESTLTTVRPTAKVSPKTTLFLSMTSEIKTVPVTVTTEMSPNTYTATSEVPTVYNRFTTSETTLEANSPTTVPNIPTTIINSPSTVPNKSTVPVITTTELPSIITIPSETIIFTTSTTEIPTVFTLTTESKTEVTDPSVEPTEPITTSPTTVPYQTSTITRVVTMVVEGATERQRIPLNKLQQAIAQHNYTRYANANLLKAVQAKEQLDKNITEEDERKDDKKNDSSKGQEVINQYKPTSNYRGRIKKPFNIEPPTTKSLPLYLSRRRTTTTTEASETTEESQLTTKSKVFGRFTPSRGRGRGRGKDTLTSTEKNSLETTKESFTVRSRTRPTRPAGSRFSSRTRAKTTTAIPLDESEGDTKPEVNESEDIRKELSLINQGNGYSFLLDSEPKTERPKFVPRGRPTRISTTTESSINDNKETTPKSINPTRPRFVLSRGRTRLTSEKPKEEDIVKPTYASRRRKISKENSKDNTDIFKTSSRFKIDRQRKTLVRNESIDDEENKDTKFIDKSIANNGNFDDKEEILISQEYTNGKTNLNSLQRGVNKTHFNQPQIQNKTDLDTIENYLFKNISGDSFNVSVLIPTVTTTEVKGILQNVNDGKTNSSTVSSSDPKAEENTDIPNQNIDDRKKTDNLNSENTTLDPLKNNISIVADSLSSDIQNKSLSHIEKNSTNLNTTITDDKNENDDADSFIEHDEEDLNLIASLYSPQSFTGRGITRFGVSKNTVTTPSGKDPKVVNRKDSIRNLKNNVADQINTENDLRKSEVLGKSSEETNFRKLGRRKVLIRKNKTNTTRDVDINKGTTQVSTSTELYKTTFNNRDISKKRGSVRANKTETIANITGTYRNGSRVKKIVVRNRNHNNGTNKVKVIQSTIKNSNPTSDLQGKRRKVVVKNRARNDTTPKRSLFSNERNSDDLIDLDTGTSLYVDRKTESDLQEDEFNRVVHVHATNDLLKGKNKNVKLISRGKLRAKDSLLKEVDPSSLFGGANDSQISEEFYDSEEEITDDAGKRLETEKIGATRLRAGFRKPGTVSVNPRNRASTSTTTTTEISPVQPEKPTGKYVRRRINKFRIEVGQNGTFNKLPQKVNSESLILELTTQKPRKFEFPRRTIKPNPLPTASPLLATTSPPIIVQEIEDNHSDESLHDEDTEIVESKEAATEEFLEEVDEVSSLPDLANVAVAAIQSLATSPPSTESIVSSTSPQPRRPSHRRTVATTTISTTTSARPKVNVHRGPPRPFAKVRTTTPPARSSYISKNKSGSYDTPDYEDYYAEPVDIPLSGKVRIHNDGYIECLDIGNFPHPFSCKKFISCAKMENGHLLGWEYTCPKGLSFDPIGGICNWSAGLGCKE